MPSPLPRRRVLVALAWAAAMAAGGSVALAGCTSASGGPAPTGARTSDADEIARRRAADLERTLAAQAAALVSRPGTSRSLAAAAGVATAAHTAHVAALLQGQPVPGPSGSSGPASASASSGVAVTAAALARAQTTAVAEHQGALGPLSGPVARLIASVAASDAALATALRGAAG